MQSYVYFLVLWNLLPVSYFAWVEVSLSFVFTRPYIHPQTEAKTLLVAFPRVRNLIGRRSNWGELNRPFIKQKNRPLPSTKNPYCQNEARCTTFLVKMSFICMRMKNDFHIKGWTPTLVLKQSPGGTRKWPILGNISFSKKFITQWESNFFIIIIFFFVLLIFLYYIFFASSFHTNSGRQNWFDHLIRWKDYRFVRFVPTGNENRLRRNWWLGEF